MDTSFEDDIAEDHCAAVWAASILYLSTTLAPHVQEAKGFNDAGLFESPTEFKEWKGSEADLIELIGRNSILTYAQKRELTSAVKYQNIVKMLIKGLAHLFCE